jgi:hypothetical protein
LIVKCKLMAQRNKPNETQLCLIRTPVTGHCPVPEIM